MSLHLNFEPHSWYKGFAIEKTGVAANDITNYPYNGYFENGNTYQVDEVHATTLAGLYAKIIAYHLNAGNGYGERMAAKRLDYLRGEIEAERISYGEIAELESLAEYIDPSDTTLLIWANVEEEQE